MQFLKNNLPNLLTCLNLMCGLAGLIILAENGVPALPLLCLLVFLAGVADFFDGFLARALGSASAIGKDLDSLADAVTFGVLPGMASYFSLREAGAGELSWIALSVPLFSVIRLAKFNNDPGQSDSFSGVPTPANAFFLIYFFDAYFFGDGPVAAWQADYTTLSAMVFAAACLLLLPVRIIALKFKSMAWKKNWDKYLLLGLSAPLMLWLGKESVPLIFLLYLLLSFASAFQKAEKAVAKP